MRSRSAMRDARSFGVEVPLIDKSSHSCPFATLRVENGDVVLSLPGDLEADLAERGQDAVPVGDFAALDPAEEVTGHGLGQAGLGLIQPKAPPLRFPVGPEAGLERPRPFRIVGPGPSVPLVQPVPERVEILLPPGRRDVEASAGGEIDARGEDVQVAAAAVLAVEDSGPAAPLRRQACPGDALELIKGLGDVGIRWRILRRP